MRDKRVPAKFGQPDYRRDRTRATRDLHTRISRSRFFPANDRAASTQATNGVDEIYIREVKEHGAQGRKVRSVNQALIALLLPCAI